MPVNPSAPQSSTKKPYVLIILDGFGERQNPRSNAIKAARTPTLDRLKQQYPNGLISGSGADVGLPDGQMGNSEVGHMNLGAGRVVYQDFSRISKAIEDKSFFSNPCLSSAIDKAKTKDSALHIMGLLSPGGVHSHEDHIIAMIDMAHQQGINKIYLHAFLDGRDTPPRSAQASIEKVEQHFHRLNCGRIASLVGRYYAMDRDNRWSRIESAYQMLTEGKAPFQSNSATEALQQAYDRDENDEFVQATLITENHQAVTINNNDVVIFMNFRADRARQICQAFVDPQFDGFQRNKIPQLAEFVMLTEYSAALGQATACAFPPTPLTNTLGEYLAKREMTQLRIAETEKYAHVTFFFSGGREDCYAGESRELIDSPDVATYDLQPEMSAPEVTDKLVAAIESQQYDLIVCNYANGDMVGHTGKFDAAVKAIETLDQCLDRVVTAVNSVQGECLITADHGNAEQMEDETSGQAHTAHTCEPVPLIYIGRAGKIISHQGVLSDIAPTILYLMGLPQPQEMTGRSLIELAQ